MTQHDLDRIRFVTGNFRELQGLRGVFTGLFLLMLGLDSWIRDHNPSIFVWVVLVVTPVLVAGSLLSKRLLDSYYSSFGEVEHGRAARSLSPRAQRFFIVFYISWLGILMLQASLHSQVSDESWGIAILKAMFLVWSGIFLSRWWTRGPRLVQLHYLVIALLMMGLAAPLDSTTPLLAGRRISDVYVLVGPLYVLTGLCDHLLLVSTMKRLATAAGAQLIEAPDPPAAEVPR